MWTSRTPAAVAAAASTLTLCVLWTACSKSVGPPRTTKSLPNLEQRLAIAVAPSFATLGTFYLLHNTPLEFESTGVDYADCTHTSFEQVLPRFEVLTHWHILLVAPHTGRTRRPAADARAPTR